MACPTCREYYVINRDALVASCASVGIEHGYTSGGLLRMYMAGYHRDGHREPEPLDAAGAGAAEGHDDG